MKRVSAFLALACLFTVSGALAAPVYTSTSSTASFTDSADWCQLASAGCTGTSASPTAWVSASSGLTGYVGLFYDSNDFTVSQDANGMRQEAGHLNQTLSEFQGTVSTFHTLDRKSVV